MLQRLGRVLMPWYNPHRDAATEARLERRIERTDRVASKLWLLEAWPHPSARVRRQIRRDGVRGEQRIREMR